MQITIESTSRIVDINGIQARVWEGKTASGIEVQVLVSRVAVLATNDASRFAEFERELLEAKPPRSELMAFPLRMVL